MRNRNRHRNRIHVATPTLATTFDDLIDPLTGEIIPAEAPSRERKRVRLASESASYIAQAAAALRAAGIASPDPVSIRQWRANCASDRQLAWLAKMAKTARWMAHDAECRDTPARDIARAYRSVIAAGAKVRAGVASDLLSCLTASLSARRQDAYAALARYGVCWPEMES